MRKIFSLIILTLGFMVAFATVNAQDVEQDVAKIEAALTVDTVLNDPVFEKYPYLYINVYRDPWAKTKLLQYNYDAFNNIWDYQRKQTKEMCIGLGISAVGIAGMVYSVNMPTPVRQVNNPALDDDADQARKDRRIVGISSIVIGTVGAAIFARSFRWTKRIKAEVGLQGLRLEYNLTGNRGYFKNKKAKKLKTIGLYPRYKK